MRFVRLKLRNICQIEKLDWEFGDGLIGIFGPNGAGKSNAALVATYTVLTGQYNRHTLGKAGLLKRGAEHGTVELTIACHGQPLTVKMDIKAGSKDEPTVKFTLDYPDNGKTLTVTGKSVFEKLKSFDIDPALLDQHVLVEQQSLHDLISVAPAERLKALGRLCGTERAEVLYKAFSEQHSLISNTIQSMNFAHDDTEAALREAKQNAVKAKRAYKQKAAKLLDADARTQLEATATGRQLRRNAVNALNEKIAQLGELDEQLVELEKQVSEETDTVQGWFKRTKRRRKQFLEARMAYETLKARREAAAAYRQLKQDRFDAEQIAAEVAPQPPKTPLTEATIETQLEELRDKIREADKLLATEGQPRCPVCGTSAAELKDAMKDARQNRPIWQAAETKLKTLRSEYAQFQIDLRTWRTRVEDAGQTVKRLTQEINKQKPPAKNLPSTKATKLKATNAKAMYRTSLKSYKEHNTQLATYKLTAAESQGAQRQLALEIDKAKKTLPPKVTAEESKAARLQLSRDDQRQEAVDELKSAYIAARTLREAAQTAHDKAEAVRVRYALLLKWQTRLEHCRDYMHRSGLPKSIHAAALGLLEERINPILRDLGAVYTASTNEEDASLIARMPDGEEFPAQALSGGQTCSLSISYRLAVKDTFASQFEALVLDEPTSGLDTRRMDCLVEFLTRVRRRAKRTGQQIIIVSHSDRLRPVFDKILEVDQ